MPASRTRKVHYWCPICKQRIGVVWAQSPSGAPTGQILAWHTIEVSTIPKSNVSITCPASGAALRRETDEPS